MDRPLGQVVGIGSGYKVKMESKWYQSQVYNGVKVESLGGSQSQDGVKGGINEMCQDGVKVVPTWCQDGVN